MNMPRLILHAGIVTIAASAAAQDVPVGPDPTRPPFPTPAPGATYVAPALAPYLPAPGVAQPAAPADTGERLTVPKAENKPGNRLTSIRLGQGDHSVALIDGKVVRVGDRIGPYRLAAIDAQGVLLRAGESTRRLWLFPSLHTRARATGDEAHDLERPTP